MRHNSSDPSFVPCNIQPRYLSRLNPLCFNSVPGCPQGRHGMYFPLCRKQQAVAGCGGPSELPGDSPGATCSYGEGFLSQTLGKQLPAEPLSACPAFIRRESIRKNKHSSSLCTHIPGLPQRCLHSGAPSWCRARLWGGRGAEEHTPPWQRDCPFFPSPSQGHIPGAESGKVRPETQTSWASPFQRDLFPASPAVAKLSFDSPVTLAPSRVPGQTGSPSATAEPERELTCSGCN